MASMGQWISDDGEGDEGGEEDDGRTDEEDEGGEEDDGSVNADNDDGNDDGNDDDDNAEEDDGIDVPTQPVLATLTGC